MPEKHTEVEVQTGMIMRMDFLIGRAMIQKKVIGDMEVVEDIFKKQKFPLDKSSNLWYNVYVS